jgi:hypothetical protein
MSPDLPTASLTAALDGLHAAQGRPARTPAPGSDADLMTGAALALIGIMRAVPSHVRLSAVVGSQFAAHRGTLLLVVADLDDALGLADRLGLPPLELLPSLTPTIAPFWRTDGTWADWPVTIHHDAREWSFTPGADA